MTRKTNHFFGALTAVLLALCAATLVLMTIAASVGVQEAQAKKPPKEINTNKGVSSINSVAAWGDNEGGQLGNGSTGGISNTPVPVSVLDESDIKALAGGLEHSLALKRDGTVWAWGWNNFGQLGNGTTADSNIPVQVKDKNDPTGFLTGVQAIDAGAAHNIALKNDGTVVTWGFNGTGQLGDGTDDNSAEDDVPHPYPVNVKDFNGVDDLTGVEAIAAGAFSSLALLEDGTVAAWGDNEYSQLGDGSNIEFSNMPREVIKLSGVEAIDSGLYHSLALLPDGTVKAWGSNITGELGYGTAGKNQFSNAPGTVKNADGTPLDGVKQLAGGGDDDLFVGQLIRSFSLALKVDGTVAAWGANDQGQLGDGTTTNRHAPVKVANLSGIKAIDSGAAHSLALTTSGKVWAWGANDQGQLGDGTTTDRHAPFQSRAVSGVVAVAAGSYHSLAG
jgi:alpha-tubulin suppressor-like RCC1 family protein